MGTIKVTRTNTQKFLGDVTDTYHVVTNESYDDVLRYCQANIEKKIRSIDEYEQAMQVAERNKDLNMMMDIDFDGWYELTDNGNGTYTYITYRKEIY